MKSIQEQIIAATGSIDDSELTLSERGVCAELFVSINRSISKVTDVSDINHTKIIGVALARVVAVYQVAAQPSESEQPDFDEMNVPEIWDGGAL